MKNTLWIPGPLPGMNELVGAAKGFGGRGYGYSRLKKQWTDAISLMARSQGVAKFPGRVMLTFAWLEASKRRDPDNVAGGGRKLALDGLVEAGVLADDGWEQVAGWTDTFAVDKLAPGVLVTLTSC